MASITVTAADVDAANNALIDRGTLGEAAAPGDALYLHSDGLWYLADASAEASAKARGVLAGGQMGTAYPAGMVVDICKHGRLSGFAGMTIGADVYVSATAGDMDQTAPSAGGTYVWQIGHADEAGVLFIDPQAGAPSAN